jgi:hypothetical protein
MTALDQFNARSIMHGTAMSTERVTAPGGFFVAWIRAAVIDIVSRRGELLELS